VTGHTPQGVGNLLIKLPRWAAMDVTHVATDPRCHSVDLSVHRGGPVGTRPGGTADIYPASQPQTSYTQVSQLQQLSF
jgi:hypothetical protein